MSLLVKTHARLQIALIDLNGAYSNRVDGSIGLSIENPEGEFLLEKNNDMNIKVTAEKSIEQEVIDSTQNVLECIQKEYDLNGIKVHIRKALPLHIGFGGKTNAIVSIAVGYCKLYGVNYDYYHLVQMVGRGGTSGIGIEAIRNGGFIVDCGHDFDKKNREFKCSSASKHIYPAPVVFQKECPKWPILVIVPNNKTHFFGDMEYEHWKKHCPIPLFDAQACAHIALMMMVPAVIENNMKIFCDGINKIQTLYWKRNLRDAQAPIVRDLFDFLKQKGLDGVGLSSAGPTVYALGEVLFDNDKKRTLLIEAKSFLDNNGGGQCFITFPQNEGTSFLRE